MEYIVKFFNSDFFVALTTFITAFAAYRIYLIQKNDQKVNAARIILSEIRNAELKLVEVKKKISGKTNEDFPLAMPANSWGEFSHLFAKDFDQDELDKINNFFRAVARWMKWQAGTITFFG